MADMSYVSNGVFPSVKTNEPSTNGALQAAKLPGTASADANGKYVAVSPKGINIPIPKELFVALSDFIATRKCPGSITIQFRSGEILCVESVAKKTYRNNV